MVEITNVVYSTYISNTLLFKILKTQIKSLLRLLFVLYTDIKILIKYEK